MESALETPSCFLKKLYFPCYLMKKEKKKLYFACYDYVLSFFRRKSPKAIIQQNSSFLLERRNKKLQVACHNITLHPKYFISELIYFCHSQNWKLHSTPFRCYVSLNQTHLHQTGSAKAPSFSTLYACNAIKYTQ